MIAVIISTAIAYLLYRKADDRLFANMISSVAIVVILAILTPGAHRGFDTYTLACAVVWVGLQVVMPLLEGRLVRIDHTGSIPELRIGRVILSVAPVGVV